MELQDFASVRSGLVLARKQSLGTAEMQYPLINLRCIRQEGSIDLTETDIFEAREPLKNEYLTQQGDIVVRLTAPYTAVLIDEATAGMVISSNFVVIRINDDRLLPEYLFWLLNTAKVKHKIYENATSNMLSAVKAKTLMNFEFELLPVKEQYEISQMYQLARKEIRLLEEMIATKEKLYSELLNQAYKKATGEK